MKRNALFWRYLTCEMSCADIVGLAFSTTFDCRLLREACLVCRRPVGKMRRGLGWQGWMRTRAEREDQRVLKDSVNSIASTHKTACDNGKSLFLYKRPKSTWTRWSPGLQQAKEFKRKEIITKKSGWY